MNGRAVKMAQLSGFEAYGDEGQGALRQELSGLLAGQIRWAPGSGRPTRLEQRLPIMEQAFAAGSGKQHGELGWG